MRDDDDLTQALRKLRKVKPSPGFDERLDQALVDADRAQRADALPKRRLRAAIAARLMLILPALASVALALHVVLEDTRLDGTRVAEHVVELPQVGHAAIDLSFLLARHDADYAAVRLDVPPGIRVTTSSAVATPKPLCDDSGCVYEFVHPTGAHAPEVQVRVSEPGRYRMRVERSSQSKHLREVVVIHAHR